MSFYEIDQIRNTIINGDALSVLKRIPDNSIDCFVTSSPYYALRSYGTQPVIWPPSRKSEFFGDFETCDHDFKITETTLHSGRGGKSQKFSEQAPVKDIPISYGFCKHCGAWRGELGQEPTPDLFLDHLLLIFAQVYRVLKPSGTCFVNIADTYAGSGGAGGDYNAGGIKAGQPRYNGSGKRTGKIKRKSLLQIPKKLCVRMVEELGFIQRNDIIWHKRNVLPQSGKDKFTPDFEYVFFFTKEEKYYFETQYEPLSEATIERSKYHWAKPSTKAAGYQKQNGLNRDTAYPISKFGRIKRTVWSVSTKPFKGAHFAVYPKDLIRPMLQAGCPSAICNKCGAMAKTTYNETRVNTRPGENVGNAKSGTADDPNKGLHNSELSHKRQKIIRTPIHKFTCNCEAGFKPGIVLDCFIGSGTTRLVAQELGLAFIGVELKPEYADMARSRQNRLLQLPARKLYVKVD